MTGPPSVPGCQNSSQCENGAGQVGLQYPLPESWKRLQQGIQSSLIGLAFNLLLSIKKCVTGVIGHSFALVADGIKLATDVVSSPVVALCLLTAIKASGRNLSL